MLDKWTGEVKGTMHIYEITAYELAKRAGISQTYLSSLLNCSRRASGAEFRIRKALMEIVEERENAEIERLSAGT